MVQPILRVSDQKIVEEFRAFVIQKYGKLRGVMSREVANALRAYMEQNKSDARAHMNGYMNTGNKTIKNLKEITRHILMKTEKEIPQPEVEMIVTRVVGGDKRTLRRYLMSLNHFGILRPTHPILVSKEPKFIYEVNLDEAKKFAGLH